MKRKITFLIAALCAVMLFTQPMKAVGQTRLVKTTTFTAGASASSALPCGTNEWSWVTSAASSGFEGQNTTYKRGVQYQANTNITHTETGATITKVQVVASTNGANNTIKAYVGNTQYGSDATITSGTSNANTTYDFEYATGTTGEIKVVVTRSASSIWIKSISVTYTTGNSVTVTSPIANGSISAAPNSGVSANTDVTLTITPDDGYALSTLSVVDGSSNPITVTNKVFKMPNSAATVTGTFATKRQVTYSATNGTIAGVDCSGTAVATNGYVGQGGTLKVTATPSGGYIFNGWTVSDGTSIDDASANPANVTLGSTDATITASFSASYTVTYHAHGGTGDDVVENKLAGATVVAIDNPFTPAEGMLFDYYTLDEEGTGTHYSPGNQIIASISANMNVYAQWRDIKYTVTLDVNGNTSVISPITNIAYGENTGAITNASMDGYTFMGWSETRNGSIAVNPGSSYSPTGNVEEITLYAVFGKVGNDYLTITASSTNPYNIPTSYNSSSTDADWNINDVLYFKHKYVMLAQNSSNYYIQFKSDGGYFYNVKDLGKITSIVVTYNTGSGSNASRDITIKIGNSSKPTGGTTMSVSSSSNVYTFTYDDEKYDYHYFYIANSTKTSTLSSVQINYIATIKQDVIPSGTTTATEAMSITTPTVISNGAILNMDNNTLSIGAGGSLVIEDGGQLICSNSVPATVKKSISAATAKDVTNWYGISSSVHKSGQTYEEMGSVTNLLGGTYDMFYYKESESKWINQKATVSPYAAAYTNMESCRGYIYRNAADVVLSYSGETNVGEISQYTLSYTSELTNDALKGINLVGNPYPHKIYKGVAFAVTADTLETGYYTIGGDGACTSTLNTVAIDVNQAVLVKAKSGSNGKKLTFKDKTKAPVAKSNNDNIKFIVSNSQYEDVAYALFDKGAGLDKINHRNADIPMIYIPQDDNNYAIAMMSDDTKSFNLNLKAMTMGQYTLSYKADGNFSYLHVIDRLTGEDVDMLMEGEYSFIASPSDAENRFIVRLEYSNGYENPEDSIFAYQSGSDIIVNGEGELQIFDVMGRRVATQYVSGVETINLQSHGVYIFKLNEKTQKIVVR